MKKTYKEYIEELEKRKIVVIPSFVLLKKIGVYNEPDPEWDESGWDGGPEEWKGFNMNMVEQIKQTVYHDYMKRVETGLSDFSLVYWDNDKFIFSSSMIMELHNRMITIQEIHDMRLNLNYLYRTYKGNESIGDALRKMRKVPVETLMQYTTIFLGTLPEEEKGGNISGYVLHITKVYEDEYQILYELRKSEGKFIVLT